MPAALLLGGLSDIASVAPGALALVVVMIVTIGIRNVPQDDLIQPLG